MAQLLAERILQVSQCATCATGARALARRGCLVSSEPVSQPALTLIADAETAAFLRGVPAPGKRSAPGSDLRGHSAGDLRRQLDPFGLGLGDLRPSHLAFSSTAWDREPPVLLSPHPSRITAICARGGAQRFRFHLRAGPTRLTMSKSKRTRASMAPPNVSTCLPG
jgi:hypothetical protein